MIDRSGMVIAVYNGSAGGTKNTLDYAEEQGIEREMIYDFPAPSADLIDRYNRITFAEYLEQLSDGEVRII